MRRLLLTAALLAAASTPTVTRPAAADDTPVKGDLARLQGSWTGKVGPNKDVPIEYTFAGDAVTVHITLGGANGREVTLKGKVRLDESAKPHKAIDWLGLSDSAGKSLPEIPGIYAFEGDRTLKFCNPAPGQPERPSEFGEAPVSRSATVVLTRKDKEKDEGKAKDKPAKDGAPVAPCDEKAGQGKDQDKDKDRDKGKDKGKADAPKGDLSKLQGTWTAKIGPGKTIPVAITIKDRAVTFTLTIPGGQEYVSKGEVKIDEKAMPHKTVDWVKFTDPMGNDAADNLGLYEFVDSDTVRFCSGGPGNERPTEFKAGDGGPPNLLLMTRQKDEPDKERGKGKDADTEAIKGDLARLQGVWTAMAGPEKNIPVTLTVKGRSATVQFTNPEGQERTMKGEVVLNDAGRRRTIDWVKFTRPDGEEAPVDRGIYTLEADEFTVCNGGPGNDRPTEFKAGADNAPPRLVVFTRKK